jgi:uncharacterized protein involved in type VI secretion and phage assembly
VPDDRRWGTAPAVEVDGVPLRDDVVPFLEEVVVDDSLHLPDLLELRLRDDGHDVLARSGLRLGATVKVSARGLGTGPSEPLLTAEIASIEADSGERGRHVVVRGYDVSWRLAQQRRTTAHVDVTDSEAAERVARGAGVPVGQVDSTSVVHPHLPQVDLSDWDFLQARARASGRECVVSRGELHFRTPAPVDGAPDGAAAGEPPVRHQLVVGSNLLRFRPRVSAHGQVEQVEVRGWDPVAKQAVVGRADTRSTGASAHRTPGELAGISGGTTHVAVDLGSTTQAEADASADALAEVVGSTHLEARGVALGDPALVAGTAVSITGAGALFDGRYVLTTTRHVYDARGYRTSFEVSGRQERSLLGLMSRSATKSTTGVTVGEVTDLRDPDSRGRVRVRLPWLSDDYETWWCRVVQLGAGDQRGSAWLPEVGDEVLVAFEQGDVHRPVVLGGLHNGVDAMPLVDGLVDATSGAVQQRGFVSRAGHRLVLDDTSRGGGVVVATGDGALQITLAQQDTVVRIASTGDVEVSGKGRVTVAGQAGVTITSDAGISLHARGQLELKGDAGVSVDGGPQVSVSGAQVRLG